MTPIRPIGAGQNLRNLRIDFSSLTGARTSVLIVLKMGILALDSTPDLVTIGS
jgi:hypothetical protein